MMILFGLGDILSALILVLRVFKVEMTPWALLLAGAYLFGKTLFFDINFAGLIDFVAGILILLSYFIILPKIFAIIIFILLLFKAVRSFAS